MTIEILPLGGLGEVGKNMTALGFDGSYIVVDMGIRLDSIMAFEDAEIGDMSREELININGIPDDGILHGRKVKAIVLTHGHLDHIGAVGKLAHAYDAPIYGTPFTLELTKRIIREERGFKVKNELRPVMPGDKVKVDGIELEFIPVTHSILQTVLILAKRGGESILCASDFKLDEEPLLGYKTDRVRLKRLAREGLSAAMVGAIRVDEPGPTPTEAHVREMLHEVMKETSSGGGLVLATTFSSHITRLKSMVDLAFELGRTPVLVGRSLRNYCTSALDLGLVDFPQELRIHGRPNAVHNLLREVDRAREDFVLICTGHQGEPTSVLSRIADGKLPLKVREGDEVIFSASVIPNPINESNRELLETKLRAQGASIHRNVHVSGHAGKVDTAEFIQLVRPEHLIPCHGTPDKLRLMVDLGRELGYSGGHLHQLRNGISLRIGG
ncbi:MAG: MBL fold metallo-hydrolase [Candidatus Hodarchaeaceae archaeon]|nr:MBL fold metallo-hydrolase [Candidatus Hodarchaeaceae archaeon]